jgi:transposase-like protein
MSGKKGMKRYPLAIKLEAVRMFLEDGKSRQEITQALGLRDPKRIQKWLRAYRQEGAQAFQEGKSGKRLGRPPKRENTAAYIARLEMENDLLKKFHAELRKLELAQRNIGSSTTKEKNTK